MPQSSMSAAAAVTPCRISPAWVTAIWRASTPMPARRPSPGSRHTETFLAGKPDTYAVILLMDVLEHVPRAAQPDFLRAIARSLRPGGRLICTVPNAGSAIGSFWLHNDYTHQWSFTADSLSGLLEQCGFGGVNCTGIEFSPRPRFLFWLPTPRTIVWWLRCLVRGRQRAAYVAELGWSRGRGVVLTPNLLAVAVRAG
jgi:SAM-dependent methyltransferase